MDDVEWQNVLIGFVDDVLLPVFVLALSKGVSVCESVGRGASKDDVKANSSIDSDGEVEDCALAFAGASRAIFD